MATLTISECEYAQQRHKQLATWRNLWTILLFIFGSSVIVFLSIAVLFLLREEWITGVITTVGTIAGGAGIRWVYKRRLEAVDEEEKAYKDVSTKCDNKAAADEERNKLKLFGQFL